MPPLGLPPARVDTDEDLMQKQVRLLLLLLRSVAIAACGPAFNTGPFARPSDVMRLNLCRCFGKLTLLN